MRLCVFCGLVPADAGESICQFCYTRIPGYKPYVPGPVIPVPEPATPTGPEKYTGNGNGHSVEFHRKPPARPASRASRPNRVA